MSWPYSLREKPMPRRLQLEGLQAELSAVSELLNQAVEMNDPMGEYQFSKRKQLVENELSTLIQAAEKKASVALFFGGKPVLGSRGISAEFAGKMLEQFQELIARSFAKSELGLLGERGPIPMRHSSNLMVTEVARGSFGFVLDELSDQSEIEDTALKTMVEEVATVIERTASPNDLEFEEVAESLDARMLIALKDFFVTLDSADATVRVVDDVADFSLDHQSIHRARARTEATSIDERDLFFEGILEGFLPDHRKFELRVGPAQVIYGSVSKEAAEQYAAFISTGNTPIGRRWQIKVRQRIIAPLNRPPREVNRLLEFISPAPQLAQISTYPRLGT
jgi:hypothetical protein